MQQISKTSTTMKFHPSLHPRRDHGNIARPNFFSILCSIMILETRLATASLKSQNAVCFICLAYRVQVRDFEMTYKVRLILCDDAVSHSVSQHRSPSYDVSSDSNGIFQHMPIFVSIYFVVQGQCSGQILSKRFMKLFFQLLLPTVLWRSVIIIYSYKIIKFSRFDIWCF